jgi:RimJ/RimL family protein N-acetyltransferase
VDLRLPADLGIVTERLSLTPLVPDDAVELADVLGDVRLHEFIGGVPAGAVELRGRYERMVAGPGRDDERWLNWVIRHRPAGEAVGTAQATLTREEGGWRAAIAWVVGVPAQGRGYASETAQALVGWLRVNGVATIVANIHPAHGASEAVARRAGLRPTDAEDDGERVWELPI